MNEIHVNKVFDSICIEGEYEGDKFENCTFKSCYIESKDLTFINCKFLVSHAYKIGELRYETN